MLTGNNTATGKGSEMAEIDRERAIEGFLQGTLYTTLIEMIEKDEDKKIVEKLVRAAVTSGYGSGTLFVMLDIINMTMTKEKGQK